MRITKLAAALAALAAIVMTVPSYAANKEAKPERQPMATRDTKPFVDGIIKAYGGKAAIEGAKNMYVKAKITADIRGDYGTYTRYMERPGKLRVEIEYTRSSELRILNGKDGWRGENKVAVKKVTDFQYNSMLYQYKQLDIPFGLLNKQYKVKWTGEAMVGGRRADILSLSDKDGIPIDVYVDSKSFLILKTVGYFSVNGKPANLSAEFTDFRKVGGTTVPYSITNYSQDTRIGTNVVVECRLNTQMKPGLFRP